MTVTIEEAQARLRELIHNLAPGEELVITENQRPVAQLKARGEQPNDLPRQSGTMKGSVLYMSPDFDAPLEGRM